MTDQELLDLAKKWEKEAQDVANKIMNEIYGPDKEPPADIPEDPVNNPNTYYGAGETPLIRNPNPADPDITDTLNETTFLLPPWLSPHVGANANGGVVWPGQSGSPLILDLNRDGVKSSNLWGADPSKSYFDMDNDGFAERTAWVAGGDGLLANDNEIFYGNVS